MKSLNDTRPGDERDIDVNIKSLSDLPFQSALSAAKVDGLNLTFTPHKLSGVPAGVSSANLHVKVLSNAAAQQRTIPIWANISLAPTQNLDNSSSAQIKKVTYFTITVSPPLDFSQQISQAWNGFGPAVNGFVGIAAALIGVGGVLGGWFLKRFKSTNKGNK